MNTHTDERRAYVESILNRLRRQYAERMPLPPADGAAPQTLSLALLQRLYKHVIAEYAGG